MTKEEQSLTMKPSGDALMVGGSTSTVPVVGNTNSNSGRLDYVGNKRSMRALFSLPFNNDKSVSVGIHNVEGCLIIDADPGEAYEHEDDSPFAFHNQATTEQVESCDPSDALALQQSVALSTISSMIENKKKRTETDETTDAQVLLQESNQVVEMIEKTPKERYHPMKFEGLNMLVGSKALVYRSTPETSLTVRVEDAAEMRQQLKHHQNFLASRRLTNEEQEQHKPGKRSYAEALRTRQLIVRPESNKNDIEDNKSNIQKEEAAIGATALPPHAMSSSDEIPAFTLQTTMIPSTNLPLGAKFSISSEPPPASDSLSSPVCTVIDAYLDQLITNVPQLALVLREKGFVQSVKLLQTEQIPSVFMQEKTFDTSRPFEVINNQGCEEEQIFDVGVMKMNAASLLNFLRANCTKDNATYLLHREAGQTNIQLLDVTAISKQRQRKWIWWLAMMSYRFAQRLRHLAVALATKPEDNAVMRRSFRARERSLLQNTLALLEEFGDMGGQPHEMLVAEVCEKLADTFLWAQTEDDGASTTGTGTNSNTGADAEATATRNKPVPATSAQQQRFGSVKPDALSKANDHVTTGIGVLQKEWGEVMDAIEKQSSKDGRKRYNSKGTMEQTKNDESGRVVSIDDDTSSGSEDEDDADLSEVEALAVKADTLALHLLSLHDKTIDIYLRLGEHHLNDYFSSSAMQALRNSARRMADAVKLCQAPTSANSKKAKRKHLDRWKFNLQIQFTRLWELCGHFARSFAADDLWRERGHAAGDDVVGVLRDVQSAIPWKQQLNNRESSTTRQGPPSAQDIFFPYHEGLFDKAWDLYDLSGIPSSGEKFTTEAIEAAKRLLEGKRQLGRDRRRVLVAASVSYSRAAKAYEAYIRFQKGWVEPAMSIESNEFALLNLLRQRQGDANNELGKLLLQELRILLQSFSATTTSGTDNKLAAEPLLSAAEFWFQEGLEAFESSSDIRNSTLLRCNLCQVFKLKANANFAPSKPSQKKSSSGASERSAHADACLKKAIAHLQAAHEKIGDREVDPGTWDMVSNELGATLLVLGVRRRQALLGGGNAPSLLHLLRLSPGETRSIIDPMEKALVIYEQSGNKHQEAAVHYQLALFFSKIWTCQRDETKTREKLSAAFKHFNAAHAFFAASLQGNETTFVLLCMDLSNLYSTVSGEECLRQALLRCLDTLDAFSVEAAHRSGGSETARSEWLKTMATLAASVEDRLFKTLRSLVKAEDESKENNTGKFKGIYRSALGAKMMATQSPGGDDVATTEEKALAGLHKILIATKASYSTTSHN